MKLAEYCIKLLNGTCTQADSLEILFHGIIDLRINDEIEREKAKVIVSQAKACAEKLNGMMLK